MLHNPTRNIKAVNHTAILGGGPDEIFDQGTISGASVSSFSMKGNVYEAVNYRFLKGVHFKISADQVCKVVVCRVGKTNLAPIQEIIHISSNISAITGLGGNNYIFPSPILLKRGLCYCIGIQRADYTSLSSYFQYNPTVNSPSGHMKFLSQARNNANDLTIGENLGETSPSFDSWIIEITTEQASWTF